MIQATQDWTNDRRIYYGIALLTIAGLAVAGWFGYGWYVRLKEEAAYKDLALSIDGYVKALGTGESEGKWHDVARAFEVGAERHPSSKMHPYFLVYQADVLIQQGKTKEAGALMDKALIEMNAQQPLYTTYALKRALLNLDSGDPASQKRGREELESLAKDTSNPTQDMALYYSALDAESRGDEAQAGKQFKEIIAHGQQRSYWYLLAENKLKAGA